MTWAPTVLLTFDLGFVDFRLVQSPVGKSDGLAKINEAYVGSRQAYVRQVAEAKEQWQL